MTADHTSLVSLADLDAEQLAEIVELGVRFQTGDRRVVPPLLDGAVLAMYFQRTSTRTRTAFSTAALRLGAQILAYGPHDLQLVTGETVDDTARVLSRMIDGLVMRTSGPIQDMYAFDRAGLSTVNAMSSCEHPTQAIADLVALRTSGLDLRSVSVLYVGEGNNTASALAYAIPRLGGHLQIRTPAGYGLAADVLATATRLAGAGGSVHQRHDLDDLPDKVDVLYTTRWQTTGTQKPDPLWRNDFVPFRLDAMLLERYPGARVMHDLPAHRGEEISADALDSTRCIAFHQAECKVSSATAVLAWTAGS